MKDKSQLSAWMTSVAVCAEGFCKKRKKDLQLCAQKPAAVCAAVKD